MIKAEDLKTFDAAEYLEDDEDIAIFLDEAFKSGNPKHVARALGIAARAKGITELAKKSGIRREHLYQALGESGNPTLQTLLPVMSAFGLKLNVSMA